ncbi:MAG: hypothetical protein R6X02_23420 [Enhygromyxa sp.]
MRSAAPALLACLLGLACTTSNSKADADEPKPDTSASTNASADSSETDPGQLEPDPNEIQAAPTPAVDLPDCPAEKGNALIHYCSEDGKLAGSWVLVDTLRVPDEVVIIFNAEGPDQGRQTSLMIATQGEALYIRHVTCGACRRVLGQGFRGHPSRMSEDQLRQMQAQLGLADDAPLLDSAEKWASFCEDEAGKRALAEIASKAEGDADGRGR